MGIPHCEVHRPNDLRAPREIQKGRPPAQEARASCVTKIDHGDNITIRLIMTVVVLCVYLQLFNHQSALLVVYQTCPGALKA
jgi:hypothetical protein